MFTTSSIPIYPSLVIRTRTIPKSKQRHLQILLNDINSNRVETILTRLNDAQDERDISNILEQLVREEMLSYEQFGQLCELEQMDLPTIALVIRLDKE